MITPTIWLWDWGIAYLLILLAVQLQLGTPRCMCLSPPYLPSTTIEPSTFPRMASPEYHPPSCAYLLAARYTIQRNGAHIKMMEQRNTYRPWQTLCASLRLATVQPKTP